MVATFVPLAHVRALWRPEQFNRCDNASFETNTTGWSVSAGINAAGTSITRTTTGGGHAGSAYGRLVTGATDGAGVNFDLGSDTYFWSASYAQPYAAIVWMRWVSGARQVSLILGSEGTASDRETLTVQLTNDWRPYRVVWLPSDDRTDAQLAITNFVDTTTCDIDDVTIYAPEGFSQVENSSLFNTTGWLVTAGAHNAAATSLTTTSSDLFTGTTCGVLTTTSTSTSGTYFALGTRKFVNGRTYRLRVAIKSVSGTTSAKLWFGTAADNASAAKTITTSWVIYELDWTPSANRTSGVEVAITNGAASVMVARFDEVEVYEASDDISAPYLEGLTYERGSNFDGSGDTVGTADLILSNAGARRFDPFYSSGPLYGSLEPGRQVWGRASYANAYYPLFYGTIETIEPSVWDDTVAIHIEDPLKGMAGHDWQDGFVENADYRTARSVAILGNGYTSRHQQLTTLGPEGETFFSGSDEVGLLDYLRSLNAATGTAMVVKPGAANIDKWALYTIARTSLMDTTDSDETVDDDFTMLSGVRVTGEALENSQHIPWQSYEQIGDYSYLAIAYDPTVYGPGGSDFADAPYLHFTNEAYGNDDDIPEPTFEIRVRKKRKGRKKRTKTRLFPGALVPLSLGDGETQTIIVDFAVAVSGATVTLDGPSGATDVDATTTATPRQVIITLTASSADIVDFIGVAGTPWLAADEQLADVIAYDQVVDKGERSPAGSPYDTPYIGSLGQAEGLGEYRNWRFGTARLRPTLTVTNRFPGIVDREVFDHITLNAARWNISGVVFLLTHLKVSAVKGDGGLRWTADWDLEEIPAGAPWFTLDTSLLDGTDVLAY